MAFSLTWLAEVLEEAGQKVAEQPGWRTRGRGEMGQVLGVMCHHTAGPKNGIMPSLGTITNGRPDLSGPLAQLGLGRDGTWFVVAAGRANHAGAGEWEGITTGNSSFIGIEAENSGLANDPWPEIQLDAYRRGVAALLKKIGADARMCCGHKEYALPKGRKPDPDFDMDAFRAAVTAIIGGAAPPARIIPAADTTGRPTLRRGSRDDLVKVLQQAIGVEDDGIFGSQTEAALRQFQRDKGLVPDGICGPLSWVAIDAADQPPAAGNGAAAPAGGGAALGAAAGTLDQIVQIAGASPIIRFPWKDRGVAPKGYIKGMALTFARVYCKLKAGDAAASEMAKAKTADADHDVLAWYDDIFSNVGMDNSAAGADTLRHLFVLMIGLGMRESSGKHCEGRDRSDDNTTADTAEAGLFQVSFNARAASPLLPTLFAQYSANPSGFLDVFREGVSCSAASLENFGNGPGRDFQQLCKECPAFAAEFAGVALRRIRQHWGPIRRKEAQVRPECDAMLLQVQQAVDAAPALVAALA